jgi:C1A family cysteine protease
MKKIKRIYNFRPQNGDFRDYEYTPKPETLASLPNNVDLRPLMPPIYDQGQLGSCVSNGTAAVVEFELMKQKSSVIMPSRLFIYYNGRVLEGTVKQDSGLQVRDGIKVVVKQGVCPEPEWPYTISKFKTKPTTKCYKDALQDVILQYQAVPQTLASIQACLAEGYPVVMGFSVYSSFESDAVTSTGIVPLPAKNESLLGGHSVDIVGYDNPSQRYIVRNSWGTSWGMAGYFTVPYTYFNNAKLASDFWMVTSVK